MSRRMRLLPPPSQAPMRSGMPPREKTRSNRVALEAMVLARHEGHDIKSESPEILRAAAK
jgi:hypothetical protein